MRALIYVIPISIAVVIGAGGALVIQAVVNPSHDSGLIQNAVSYTHLTLPTNREV